MQTNGKFWREVKISNIVYCFFMYKENRCMSLWFKNDIHEFYLGMSMYIQLCWCVEMH